MRTRGNSAGFGRPAPHWRRSPSSIHPCLPEISSPRRRVERLPAGCPTSGINRRSPIDTLGRASVSYGRPSGDAIVDVRQSDRGGSTVSRTHLGRQSCRRADGSLHSTVPEEFRDWGFAAFLPTQRGDAAVKHDYNAAQARYSAQHPRYRLHQVIPGRPRSGSFGPE